jgi:hypothetical protein
MKPRRQRNVDVTTESAIRTWAYQRRSIITGVSSVPSLLGRLKDQGPAAGETGKRRQRWAEVYTGDGLLVQRILVRMSETPRLVLSCYYLLTGPWFTPAKVQASEIGISRTQYWGELEKGEEAVQTGLRLVEDVRTPLGLQFSGLGS